MRGETQQDRRFFRVNSCWKSSDEQRVDRPCSAGICGELHWFLSMILQLPFIG